MASRPYNLAIETSARRGSISLGHDDRLIDQVELVQPHRHNIELTPAIDELLRRYHVPPAELGEVYLSIGPGSFTGLRIAVATAKMLALVLDVRIVAVPTLQVVVANAPVQYPHVAVGLNTKRNHMYTGIFSHLDGRWQLTRGPDLLTAEQVCNDTVRPLAVLGDHLPDYAWPDYVTVLDSRLALPCSNVVWRLARAGGRSFVDPLSLIPLYAREPEAAVLWRKRQAKRVV